ncbi:helix-turn-helix domain-containing protein [Allosalinactinospora lopnorensis]|uniref:helix-turn-helix domain-containing protein n=1 Tax=Allosalinactinospora lopnorensis TaxID=1352348 RepID=UPI000623DC96|nr:helix-turn-helix transcriptional regulator [Allosalinactinospora lopnorensis]
MAEHHRPRSFAATLDNLCRNPVGRRSGFTNTELARDIGELGGDITDGYISQLRKGQRDNPTLQTVEDLAAALDVCPAVFIGGRRDRRGDERPRLSFPAKLRRLFRVVYPPGRGPYTPEEVAKTISENGQFGSISSSYIRELLNPPPAEPPNPRLKHLLGLAGHFRLTEDSGPQAAYFLDDELAGTVDTELDEFAARRDAGIVDFVARMVEETSAWSPEMRRQTLEAVIQAVESADASWILPFRRSAPPPSQEGDNIS